MSGPGPRTRVVTALVALAAAVPLAGCGKLDDDAVQTMVGQVVSTTAEGALVAREAHRARTTESFVETRTAELHHAALATQDKLDGATAESDAGQKAADETSALAAAAAAQLERLHEHPNDVRVAGDVEGALLRLAQRAQRVEQTL